MAIDLTDLEFGEDPEESTKYLWRISSVFAKETKDQKSLRLAMSATIVDEGPQAGFEAQFPAYLFKHEVYDMPVSQKKREIYAPFLKDLARLVGESVSELRQRAVLPGEEGERTDFIDDLTNVVFEASAKWQDPQGQYEGRWFVGRDFYAASADQIITDDEQAF
jgi:hypothetical protein